MQHRISKSLGFGGGYQEELENNIKLDNSFPWDKFYEDAKNAFYLIKVYEGFDYHIWNDSFSFGIEPSYRDDPYFRVQFNFEDKGESWICRGRAFGYYGSKVGKVYKFYKEYERQSKFIAFIDKWYEPLKEWATNQKKS